MKSPAGMDTPGLFCTKAEACIVMLLCLVYGVSILLFRPSVHVIGEKRKSLVNRKTSVGPTLVSGKG